MAKIKKGQQVIVIAGKDKGKKGEVKKVLTDKNRVIISGVNKVKKHEKPSQMSQGGIVTRELPIHISNVAIADPKTGEPSRLGYKTLENGEKVRFAKKSGEIV